jgi:hypothetical protein
MVTPSIVPPLMSTLAIVTVPVKVGDAAGAARPKAV